MKTKGFIALLIVIFFINYNKISTYEENAVIVLDDYALAFNHSPVMVKGSIFVPVDNVLRSIGFTTRFKDSFQIILEKENSKIKFEVGSNDIKYNQLDIKLEEPVIKINGTIFVQIDLLDHLGVKYRWDRLEKSLYIDEVEEWVKVNENKITIAHKYDTAKDLWIEFEKCGVNKIMGVGKFYFVSNSNKEVANNFDTEHKIFKRARTDWIGPYIVRAKDNYNQNYPTFTGGWHGYNGNATGSPTGKTINYKVFADGNEIKEEKIMKGKRIDIEVENEIQGYNTKRSDGKGRSILKEIVTYTIIGGKIDVSVEIKALENLVIERYYGLQSDNLNIDGKISYGQNGKYINGSIDSHSETKQRKTNIKEYHLISKDDKHKLHVFLNKDFGIGNLEYIDKEKPIIFTKSYGKTYFNLINGIEKEMSKGEKIYWGGYYKFTPIK